MITFISFYEQIMAAFCTDNITNNIQYGVILHYPQYVWRNHSQEPWWIGMGFTIGIPVIHSGGVHTGWIRDFVKGAEPEGLRDFCPPAWSSTNPRYRGSNWRSHTEAEAKYQIRVQLVTFSCTKLFAFMNTGAKLLQRVCANTQRKKIPKMQYGWTAIRLWVSPCPDNKRSGGAAEV